MCGRKYQQLPPFSFFIPFVTFFWHSTFRINSSRRQLVKKKDSYLAPFEAVRNDTVYVCEKEKLVGQSGFEPPTNGYLQLQNFVIHPKVSAYPFCDASGAHRNTGLYYYPAPINFL